MAINMQYAINKVGKFRVIFASILSGITKIFGIRGVFYRIVGREVSGLDGFYDGAWNEYKDIGIKEYPFCLINPINLLISFLFKSNFLSLKGSLLKMLPFS